MTEPGTSWRDRLFGGLKRTSDKLGENLTGLFTKAALDDQTLDEIEEALIVSDLGPAMAARVRDRLSEGRYNRELTEDYLREIIAEEIEKVLAGDRSLSPSSSHPGHRRQWLGQDHHHRQARQ